MPVTWFDGVTITVEAALSAATGAAPALNSNPYFETELDPWVVYNGTAVRSSEWARQGSWSVKITATGGHPNAYVESEPVPVTAGNAYVVSGWLYSPTVTWPTVSTANGVSVNWYDAAFGYLSTSLSGGNTLPAGVPVGISTVFTAPAGAAYAGLLAGIGNSPPAGQVVHADALTITAPQSYGTWNSATWNGALWGPDVIWQDISGYTRSIRTDRVFSRELGVWGSGTATIVLDNSDGQFSPSNMAGPYVTAGVTGVRPWRPIRVRATYAGVTYDIYRGYALDWLETWDPSDNLATVTVPCVDEWARLSKFGGVALTSPVGAGELSGRRIHRILDNAGHTGARNIESGTNTMQATDLAKNAADELKLVTDSEGGGLFIDGDGAVVFERQYALLENGRSNTPQVTFVDAANAAQGLRVADMQKSYGGDVLVNIAAFQRVGGLLQTVTDEASRSLYADLRESRTDLICQTDAQALSLATLYVQMHKDPEDRVKQVVIKPRKSPATMFPAILARRVRDMVRAIRTPRAGGYTIDQVCHIAGISHDITPGDWTVTIPLMSATVYRRYSTSRWDVGAWDSASWFF